MYLKNPYVWENFYLDLQIEKALSYNFDSYLSVPFLREELRYVNTCEHKVGLS